MIMSQLSCPISACCLRHQHHHQMIPAVALHHPHYNHHQHLHPTHKSPVNHPPLSHHWLNLSHSLSCYSSGSPPSNRQQLYCYHSYKAVPIGCSCGDLSGLATGGAVQGEPILHLPNLLILILISISNIYSLYLILTLPISI